MEADCGEVPEALRAPGCMASRQHAGSLRWSVGADVFLHVDFVVADGAAGGADGGVHGARVHHFS